MKKTTWILALAALLFAISAEAQTKRTVANLPTTACTAGNIEGRFFIVTDADTLADCTSGGGTSVALCICDGGSFIPLAGTTVADMAGSYVPLTKAGQQTMTATGAGNDITFTSPDDIFFVTGVGQSFDVDGGAAGADGFDVALGNGGIAIYEWDASAANDAKLDMGGGEIDLSIGSGPEVTVTAGAVLLTGATSIAGTLAVDAAGGVDELGVSDKVVSVAATVMLRLVPQATPPAACAAGTEGGLYLDSDTHLLCVCDATGWVQVADGTTGCS